jgi:hypothetical protein
MLFPLKQNVCFKGFTCFFNLAEEAYWVQNEPFLTLKTMVYKKCSFQMQTHSHRETMC